MTAMRRLAQVPSGVVHERVSRARCCIQAACHLWGNPVGARSGRGYARQMPGEDWWPRCDHCNDRIGVYEPVWVVEADGRSVAISSFEIHTDPHWSRSRVLHLGCAADAGFGSVLPN